MKEKEVIKIIDKLIAQIGEDFGKENIKKDSPAGKLIRSLKWYRRLNENLYD